MDKWTAFAWVGVMAAWGCALIFMPIHDQRINLQTKCFHGYLFVTNDSNPRQMIDEQGHGVKCEES